MTGHWNMTEKQNVLLFTTATLMSAKLEQDTSPSFNRMLSLLSNKEYRQVSSKQELIDLELDILIKFGLDFNFPGPVESMERFLHLLGFDKNKEVDKIARNLLR